jgi:hypothetical protein
MKSRIAVFFKNKTKLYMCRFSFALHLITIPLFFFRHYGSNRRKKAVSPALDMDRCMVPQNRYISGKIELYIIKMP